ncbi:hypothetical protein SAMN05216559_0146 [Halomicrobium zhouii]|uniref:Uncharacterized protein n=1 Tax=Halomicrobium zhouii TaxID=767519 RepID=A0A1I6K3S8_9EURY|nr:hypothetical protein [Halomicrobium zhouii]SFR85879.1 hypothetical protein SAMN05216559_0146 [Halomicrobium zhouii]
MSGDTNFSRRALIKRVGACSVAGITASGITSASPTRDRSREREETGDGANGSSKESIRQTSAKEVYELYRETYGKDVARKAKSLWVEYANAVLEDRLSHSKAFARFKQQLADYSPEFRRALENQEKQSEREQLSPLQQSVADGNVDPDDESVSVIGGVSTQDNQDILLIDGQENGSGVVGFRKSDYDTGKNHLLCITATPGAGDVRQEVWLEGNIYVQNGGPHDIVLEYFENGGVIGASASYDVWVMEEGDSHKTWHDLKSVNSSVNGSGSIGTRYNFADDTVYNVGIRLKCVASGLGKAAADFHTINGPSEILPGDSPYRHLEAKTLRISEDG